MVDPHVVIREFLELQPLLSDVDVYAGRDVPPPDYTPGDVDAIVFKVRGGAWDYGDGFVVCSVPFKCYSTSEVSSYELYMVLHDLLHGAVTSSIHHAEEEIPGQPLREPGTEWSFTLVYYTIRIRQT